MQFRIKWDSDALRETNHPGGCPRRDGRVLGPTQYSYEPRARSVNLIKKPSSQTCSCGLAHSVVQCAMTCCMLQISIQAAYSHRSCTMALCKPLHIVLLMKHNGKAMEQFHMSHMYFEYVAMRCSGLVAYVLFKFETAFEHSRACMFKFAYHFANAVTAQRRSFVLTCL
jgi:hypothetical protein